MTRAKWKLTQAVVGEPKIDEFGDPLPPVEPFSLLAEIAREPGSGLIEIRPGLYSSTPVIELPPG